ncbi:MAG TPA: HEPN domain-containing protein [Anaerolineales bacterium]|nr:HEPN domain-containing protein [Anaerolineales bacterium]
MKPHIEEAYRALVLADRDITAFEILKKSKDAHIAIVGFHAQQAIEKSLKAVLFAHQIEFDRSHDLVKLAGLLRVHQIEVPVEDKKWFFGNRRGGLQILGCEWGIHPTHTPKSGINHGKSQRA